MVGAGTEPRYGWSQLRRLRAKPVDMANGCACRRGRAHPYAVCVWNTSLVKCTLWLAFDLNSSHNCGNVLVRCNKCRAPAVISGTKRELVVSAGGITLSRQRVNGCVRGLLRIRCCTPLVHLMKSLMLPLPSQINLGTHAVRGTR